jgi:hypothetical protein
MYFPFINRNAAIQTNIGYIAALFFDAFIFQIIRLYVLDEHPSTQMNRFEDSSGFYIPILPINQVAIFWSVP